MKRLVYVLIVFAFISCKSNENKNAEGTSSGTSSDTTQTKAAKAEYTCPMHPEVVSDTAAQCPKCGMDLEVKS